MNFFKELIQKLQRPKSQFKILFSWFVKFFNLLYHKIWKFPLSFTLKKNGKFHPVFNKQLLVIRLANFPSKKISSVCWILDGIYSFWLLWNQFYHEVKSWISIFDLNFVRICCTISFKKIVDILPEQIQLRFDIL